MFRSEVADDAITASLDKSIDIIERQIRKNKTRLEKRLKVGAFVPYEDDVVEEDEIKITKVKHFELSPMSAEEAVLQMNLLGHEFFLFKNEETGITNLVYKKADNEYGLIEPTE